jgi:hypothetical protein
MSATNPIASFVLGILAFDAPAPRDPAVLSAIAISGVLIAVGIVGLANASGTRHLYGGDIPCGGASADPATTDIVGVDHGGVGRQRCS